MTAAGFTVPCAAPVHSFTWSLGDFNASLGHCQSQLWSVHTVNRNCCEIVVVASNSGETVGSWRAIHSRWDSMTVNMTMVYTQIWRAVNSGENQSARTWQDSYASSLSICLSVCSSYQHSLTCH